LLKGEKEMKKLHTEIKSQIKGRLSQLIQPNVDFDGSPLINYKWYFEREKTLYKILNLFQAEKSWFKGLCWCPLKNKDRVNDEIDVVKKNKKVVCSYLKEVQDHELTPPTYFECNDFFMPFQEIVFTYGVPAYKEANPVPFTIISFSFLFGVMFGDFCHGLILLSFGVYICIRREHLINTKSVLCEILPYRYLVLLLGVFASFSGFLYNEFASVPLNFISTCYDVKGADEETLERSDPSCVHPTSIDPIWYASVNELQFINSYKMKLSVILGVTHMTLGVILKGFNAIYFNNSIDFFFEFIPRLLFLVGFFGYMNAMIMIKWVTDWSFVKQNAPPIITLLIGIALKGADPGDIPLYGDGTLQRTVGMFIVSNLNLNLSTLCHLYSLDVRYKTRSSKEGI
jgi:V-type H+-transporting ATPase subunit a